MPVSCSAWGNELDGPAQRRGIAAGLGDRDQAIDPLDLIEFYGECSNHEGVNAQAGLEKLIDLLDGGGLALGVVVRELFGFASPRTFQDIVHVQIDTGENLIDLVISLRFIAGTFMC